MERFLLAAGIALLLAAPAAAQTVSVVGAFDRPRAMPGQVLTYTLTISGSEVRRPSLAASPRFDDFDVLGGPSTGRSTQVTMTPAGTSSLTVYTFSWRLVPRKEGVLAVPPVEVSVGSGVQVAARAEVEVTTDPGRAAAGARQQAPVFPGGAPSPQPPPRARSEGSIPWEGPSPVRRGGDPLLAVRCLVDDSEVWLGEELVATHVVDFDVLLRTYAPVTPSEFPGFAATARDVEPTGQWVDDTKTGERFRRAPLAQWALVPLVVGDHELPGQAYRLDVEVRDDPFAFLSGRSRTQSVVKRSSAVHVTVKPLPADAPASFSGATGSFQLAASLSAASIKAGDGATLNLTVSGSGNFESVTAPRLALPADLSLFDPEVKSEVSANASGHSVGKKTFAFPLLARAAGTFEIPALQWAFFDPRTGRYVERETRPLVLEVVPSAEAPVASLRESSAVQVQVEGSDIHHVRAKLDADAPRALSRELPAWLLPATGMGPLVVLGAVILAVSRTLRRDPIAGRAQSARTRARRRLKEARAHAAAGRPREAADTIARGVAGFIGDRLALGEAELSPAEAASAVAAAAGPEQGERVRQFLADCDFARFASVGNASPDAAALLATGEKLLDDLAALTPRREAA